MNSRLKSWAEVTLGEICEFKYGKSLPEAKRTGDEVPVYGSNGIVGHHNKAITDGMTIVVGRKGSLGEVNVSLVSCWSIDTTYYIDRNATDTDLRWLAYQLANLKLTELNKSAAVPGLNREDAYRKKLLLPPIAEQKRIATILDKAESLRSLRRQALIQLNALTQSIFLEMFGDPVTNSKEWLEMPFGDVCETRLGKMVDQKKQTGQHKRMYLRNANVQWFRFDLTDLFEIDFDAADREKLRLQYGDLLICEGGEPGRAAIWRDEIAECYYQKALHRARPNKDLANSEYLAWLLWFLSHRGGLGDHVTAATIAHLTGEKLKVMRIPLPLLPLQQEFARRVEAVDRLKTTHRESLTHLDALFASLQHRAFRGEL